jgi:hypothetical protein
MCSLRASRRCYPAQLKNTPKRPTRQLRPLLPPTSPHLALTCFGPRALSSGDRNEPPSHHRARPILHDSPDLKCARDLRPILPLARRAPPAPKAPPTVILRSESDGAGERQHDLSSSHPCSRKQQHCGAQRRSKRSHLQSSWQGVSCQGTRVKGSSSLRVQKGSVRASFRARCNSSKVGHSARRRKRRSLK